MLPQRRIVIIAWAKEVAKEEKKNHENEKKEDKKTK